MPSIITTLYIDKYISQAVFYCYPATWAATRSLPRNYLHFWSSLLEDIVLNTGTRRMRTRPGSLEDKVLNKGKRTKTRPESLADKDQDHLRTKTRILRTRQGSLEDKVLNKETRTRTRTSYGRDDIPLVKM